MIKTCTFKIFFLINGNNKAATNDKQAKQVFIIPDVEDEVNYGNIHYADY